MTKEEKEGCMLVTAMFAVVFFLVFSFAGIYAFFSKINSIQPKNTQIKKR